MKTIEERAKEYAPGTSNSDSLFPTRISTLAAIERRGYIAGATEQKAIDIDKACEWLKKELQKIAVDEVKENFLENNFNIILKSQVPNWLTNFRKAMEKEL